MIWTLLVPGGLLPAPAAPALVRAMQAPGLVRAIVEARRGPSLVAAEDGAGAAHWAWLARAFVPAAGWPVTAPYAWHALAPATGGAPAPQAGWFAHCDPVHMSIARDHFVVSDLGATPLGADDAQELLALANEAAAPQGLAFAIRGGYWFLLCGQDLQLQACPLDAVLGQSAQDRLPTGSDARRWRVLLNEIQMRWHASAVNERREQQDARVVNGLWIHGAGRWRALPVSAVTRLHADPAFDDDEPVVRGWLDAAATAGAAGDGTLSIYRGMYRSYAHQAWESWLAGLGALQQRLEQDLARARACGATRLDLVLCGARETRTLRVAVRPS